MTILWWTLNVSPGV